MRNQKLTKEDRKAYNRQVEQEDRDRNAGSMGAATLAAFCLGGAYLLPSIGSYFVIAAVVFAIISYLLSR